jgi:hypothetical protein
MSKLRYAAIALAALAAAPNLLVSDAWARPCRDPIKCKQGGSDSGGGPAPPSAETPAAVSRSLSVGVNPAECAHEPSCGSR